MGVFFGFGMDKKRGRMNKNFWIYKLAFLSFNKLRKYCFLWYNASNKTVMQVISNQINYPWRFWPCQDVKIIMFIFEQGAPKKDKLQKRIMWR